MRKEATSPLLGEVEFEAGSYQSPRCMGIGTGGVVCQERAAAGSMYCRHCDPSKKLAEMNAIYHRLWAELLPMPESLQPELDGIGPHSDLEKIWVVVNEEPVPKKWSAPDVASLFRRKTYLDKAISWVARFRSEAWAKIERLEDEIQELEETIAADALVEELSVSNEDLANPVYPPLPHQVQQPANEVVIGPHVYRVHFPEF